MKLFEHRHHALTAEAPAWVCELYEMLSLVLKNQETIMSELDNLTAQVAGNRSAIDSAVVLINGIADRITQAGTDPAKLAALTADLKSEDDTLAAAVVANTPVAGVTGPNAPASLVPPETSPPRRATSLGPPAVQ